MTMTKPVPQDQAPAPRAAGISPAAFLPPLFGALAGPVPVNYLPEGLGAAPLAAMLLGGATCLPRLVVELIRRRRLVGIGSAVLIGFVLGAVLTLTTGNARALEV